MMAYAVKQGSTWIEIDGSFIVGEGDDAIQYPPNWPELATNEERAHLGIVAIEEPESPPSDSTVLGSTLTGDDAPTRVWTIQEPDLSDCKAIYKARAEAIRDAKVNGGCMTPSGRVDTTLESRMNISGSVQMAGLLGAGFNAQWRREDNTYATLNAAAMAAVGLAAGTHVATCYNACFAIKDAIDAATTVAAVRAISLDTGYPA
jgi:hypothetical protein